VHQLLLLDRQLPDGDGAGFVAVARACPNLAVIMLTAKGTLSDKVEAWMSVPMTTWSSRWRSRN
jgi:DNA-binding response OmpR family regulator